MPNPIPANSVEVVKRHQARCRLPGCNWRGDLKGTYQEANDERQAHLDEHRSKEAAQ